MPPIAEGGNWTQDPSLSHAGTLERQLWALGASRILLGSLGAREVFCKQLPSDLHAQLKPVIDGSGGFGPSTLCYQSQTPEFLRLLPSRRHLLL